MTPMRILLAAVLVVAAATTTVSAAPEAVDVAKTAVAMTRLVNAAQQDLIAHVNVNYRFSTHSSPDVRGRFLAETKNMCEYEKESKECMPGKNAMKDFKPATPEGQNLVDTMFKPELECQELKKEDECKANSKCQAHPDMSSGKPVFKECGANPVAFMAPPAVCDAKEKKPVTMTSLMVTKMGACQANTDETKCKASKDSCLWSSDAKFCSFDFATFAAELMLKGVGAQSPAASFAKIGATADACKARGTSAATKTTDAKGTAQAPAPAPAPAKTTDAKGTAQAPASAPAQAPQSDSATLKSTCETDAKCAWDASKSECDISEAETTKLMGVTPEAMNEMQKQFVTCNNKTADEKQCTAPCAVDGSKCVLGPEAIISGTFGSAAAEGPYKNLTVAALKCGMSNSNASKTTCEAAVEGCTYNANSKECDYSPPMASIMTLMNAPVPGYPAECPSLFQKATDVSMKCVGLDKGKCATATDCEYQGEEEGCQVSPAAMYTVMAGEEDGKNMASMIKACEQHKNNEGSCNAQAMDLDFFGKKNPTKKKVTTAMSFKGVDNVDSAATAKMKKAIAATIGDDVKAEDIVFTKVHFPVKAKLKLTTTVEEAKKPEFQTKFKAGVAKDLGVAPNDVKITAVTEAAASRRRNLLAASATNVAFTVENAKDADKAKTLSTTLSNSAGLTELAAATSTSATVVEAPSYELEVEMELAVDDAKADAVSTKIADSSTTTTLADNLKSEGITATVTVTEKPVVRANTYEAPASSAAVTRFHTVVGVVLATLAVIIF